MVQSEKKIRPIGQRQSQTPSLSPERKEDGKPDAASRDVRQMNIQNYESDAGLALISTL